MPPPESATGPVDDSTTTLPDPGKRDDHVRPQDTQTSHPPHQDHPHGLDPQKSESDGSTRDPPGLDYNATLESLEPTDMDSLMQQLEVSGKSSSRLQNKHQLRPHSNEVYSGNSVSDSVYLDLTPTTPRPSRSPSRTPPPLGSVSDSDNSDKKGGSDLNGSSEEGTTSEIQSIIEQFDGGCQDRKDEVLSPRAVFGNPMLGNPVQHPPRKSSLERAQNTTSTFAEGSTRGRNSDVMVDPWKSSAVQTESGSQGHEKTPSVRSFNSPQATRFADQVNDTTSPHSSISGPRPQPPEPEIEPEVPFDFHRFLEQLRHRTADPVAKFLRSFLLEFGKKQWMVHEQVKIISDFLTFITGKMAQCDVWRGVSDAEFDNAKEGMEKLVMNRLYLQAFSPAIPPSAPPPDGKGRRKNIEKLLGPGRKGQHQEDIERDEVLGQKVRIYRWVQEEHLDIPPLGDNGRRFMSFAQQQLLKIKMYRAPRDKVVCVLNCCKVIFGFLSTSKSADTSADSFVPLLIYVVLRANPDHLVSNIQYILRFRNQEKLGGEAGYYLSSLMGAIQFIENLDRTSLTVSDEEFEKRVEASVSEIAERHEEEEESPFAPEPPAPPPRPTHISEKSGLSEPQMIPRNSMEAEYNSPSNPLVPLSSRTTIERRSGTGSQEDSNAVSGLLRTIQKPLSSIGRMFSDDTSQGQFQASQNQPQHLPPSNTPLRLSPAVFQPPRRSIEEIRSAKESKPSHTKKINAEEAAARQASAEAAEAHRIQRNEHRDVVE
ncbi:MAG: hypothetical protein Q9170_001747 [Blastenia crenularia]